MSKYRKIMDNLKSIFLKKKWNVIIQNIYLKDKI